MFKHYFKTAWRNVAKDKILTAIYLGGLSISIAACALVLIWVNYQYSFDKFNKNAKDIYRVYSRILVNGNNFSSSMAPPPLCDLLKNEFPNVVAATRVWKYNNMAVTNEGNGKTEIKFNEEVYQADSSFFQIFDYKMLQGNPDKSLSKPLTIVITKSTAIKYFGEAAFNNGSVMGKSLSLFFSGYRLPCKITGITKDVPANAHFHYNIIFSNISDPWNQSRVWVDNTYYTYILLKKGTDPKTIESNIPAAIKSLLNPQLKSNFSMDYDVLKRKGNYWEYKLQPLTDIHLHSDFERELEPGENASNVYILTAAAIFLLLMACINYANLSTANSIRRSKEIGIRKTLGSSKSTLCALVFTETGTISLTAWVIAVLLIAVCTHPFEILMHTTLPTEVFKNTFNWLVFTGLFFIINILGGLFPAFYLASLNIVKAVKGKITPGARFLHFRNGLIITQFVIFIALIVCTSVVYCQLNFMRGQSPGFKKENVVVINDPSLMMGEKQEAFMKALAKQPNIVSANACMDFPGSGNDNFPIAAKSNGTSTDHLLANFSAGYDFLKTFNIALLHGRDFNRQMDNDTLPRIILNEAAVKELDLQNPVGSFINTKYLNALKIETKKYEVIGVTKNFNFQSLHKAVRPMAIFLNTKGIYTCVRINPGNTPATIAAIKNIWQSFLPGVPFEFHFVDQAIDNLYKIEAILNNVLIILTALIIFVAVIGITGLTLLTVQQRTKETGIRKVIGATVYDILFLFSKDYIKWVLVSFTIAVPIANFTMHTWLQNFAFPINIGWWMYAAAGFSAMVVVLATVSMQAFKAATSNPVHSLRTE